MLRCYNNREFTYNSMGWEPQLLTITSLSSSSAELSQFSLVPDCQAERVQQVWGNYSVIFTAHYWCQWTVQRGTVVQPSQVGLPLQESNSTSSVFRMVEKNSRASTFRVKHDQFIQDSRISPIWLSNNAPVPTKNQWTALSAFGFLTFWTGFQQHQYMVLNFHSFFLSNSFVLGD